MIKFWLAKAAAEFIIYFALMVAAILVVILINRGNKRK